MLAARTAPARPWHTQLRQSVTRNQWMLADQALVSSMNFLTTALLARMLGVYQFGIFSILYIVLMYINSVQLSLIVSPMMTLAPQMPGAESRSYLRGMWGAQLSFSALSAVLVCLLPVLTKLGLLRSGIRWPVLLAFMATLLFFQSQDWMRRFWYVLERGRAVFLNDLISYAGQLALLLVLWKMRRANVALALWAIALTSLAAWLAGAWREDIWGTLREMKSAIRRSAGIARSLLVANQFQWIGSQGILLIVAATTGVSAASGMRAVITLLGPINSLYLLLDNTIPVRASRTYAASGRAALVAYLGRTGLRLTILIGLPLLAIALAAKPIMTLVFGTNFETYASLVAWQAAYAFLALVYRGIQYFHRTVGTPAILARTALIVSVCSVAACVLLSERLGALGGMMALVAGQLLNVLIPLWPILRDRRGPETT
jgi:O-antigen/teichoic acid export membrane protein